MFCTLPERESGGIQRKEGERSVCRNTKGMVRRAGQKIEKTPRPLAGTLIAGRLSGTIPEQPGRKTAVGIDRWRYGAVTGGAPRNRARQQADVSHGRK
jgi:hypothetical protein